jgi:hypothetical protein
MEPSGVITAYRDSANAKILTELQQYFIFKQIITNDGTTEDENLNIRTELTELLLSDYSLKDIELIRALFRAELECERAIWRHDNLYQLSFYLYSLGQLEDTFLLYEAKYGLRHMDASTMQDRYSITVGHEPSEVIKYVEDRFRDNPNLRNDYSGLLDELQGIIDCPDYDSIADYSRFIRGYFFGHENVALNPDSNENLSKAPNKPWWKFW